MGWVFGHQNEVGGVVWAHWQTWRDADESTRIAIGGGDRGADGLVSRSCCVLPAYRERTEKAQVQVRALAGSAVVVQAELVRVRTEPDRVDLVGSLHVDPRLDEIRGEDATLEQIVVVLLQAVDHRGQRRRSLCDADRKS